MLPQAHIIRLPCFEPVSPAPLCLLWGYLSAFADFFSLPVLGKLQEVIQGVIPMIVKKGRGTYVYNTTRVNGKPVTKYIGKSTSPQAKTYEKGQEEQCTRKNREAELARLHQELE